MIQILQNISNRSGSHEIHGSIQFTAQFQRKTNEKINKKTNATQKTKHA